MKKLLAILLLICLLFSVTACHGKKKMAEFVMPEEFDTGKDYEITFWAKNDTNKNQTAVYNRAIEEFGKLYPNIHVTIRAYTDYTKIYDDVIANIATQTTPNVCITYPDHIATYITGANVVVPLETLMDNAQYGLGGSEVTFASPKKEDIIEEYLEEGVISGTQYALPFMRSTEATYINQDMVEKLGYTVPDVLTWDFIWEVSEAAMEQNADGTYAVNGQNVLIPFIYKSTDNMMIQYLHQAGAGYSTENGDIEIFNDTTTAFLKEIAEHSGSGAFSTFKFSGYPGNFLNAGQCIFAVDSTAGATWMGADAPLSDIAEEAKVDFTMVTRPVPQIDPNNPSMISQGPSVCIFNKADPQEVLASWLFAQFLLSEDIQTAYAMTEGYVPVTKTAQEGEQFTDYLSRAGEDAETYYQAKIDVQKMLLANTANTFVTPVYNGSASLRLAAGQLIENMHKSVRRGQTVDDAYMEQLKGEITSLYHLDQKLGETGK